MRIAAIAFAMLFAAGCTPKTESGEEPPQDALELVHKTKLATFLTISVLRDRTTRCDYLLVDGESAYSLRPRTMGRQIPVCGTAQRHDFSVTSVADVPGGYVYRLLDKGTRCEWFWADGDESGELTPVISAGGMQRCGGFQSDGETVIKSR